ncbi:MAG TPA: glycosyltransferase family A protein [Acidimicrobiales bacterium]|nr:glycosyltransferase family A protein [Acidimicrobiales bacterium]
MTGRLHPSRDLTVVVPTRDRPDRLAACLDAIERLDPPPREVVVVDSGSSGPGATAPAHGRATVLRCERPGASRARNAGWRAASGSLVGFVDDDVRVAPSWAAALCAPFADERVAFVTGAVVGGEALAGAAAGDRPVAVTDDVRAGPIDRGALGNVGASASLAVRRSALEAVGGFDELLGAGARFRSAEDIDLFDRLLVGGIGWHAPEAVAHHDQWRSRRELLALELAYGSGYGVRLAKVLRADPARGRALAQYEARRLVGDVAHDLRGRYAFGVVSRVAWAAAALQGWASGRRVAVRDGHLHLP